MGIARNAKMANAVNQIAMMMMMTLYKDSAGKMMEVSTHPATPGDRVLCIGYSLRAWPMVMRLFSIEAG
jgi:hypothetical protein